jgi:hypothetical protein
MKSNLIIATTFKNYSKCKLHVLHKGRCVQISDKFGVSLIQMKFLISFNSLSGFHFLSGAPITKTLSN